MSFIVVLAVIVVAWFAVSYVRRHQRSLVPERGTGVGADLGALSGRARVRVEHVSVVGLDRVRVVLTAVTDSPMGCQQLTAGDLDFVASLGTETVGWELLREWQQSACPLAIVIPPGSHLVRLRSIEDLQPLTLRRIDQG